MIKKIACFSVTLAAFAAFALLSCGVTSPSDEETLGEKINGEYAAYFNDGETMGGGQQQGGPAMLPAAAADATLPQGWYRAVTFFQRYITISITAPYTSADVYVKDDIRGTMYIDRTADGKWNPGAKPFAVWRERYATFERADTDSPWYLAAISIANYTCQDAGKQTVNVTSVHVVGPGFNKTYTDAKTPIPLAELPNFAKGADVTVTAVAHNTSAEGWTPVSFGFMHHDGIRENMTDKGEQTYEKEYTIGTKAGVHHGGVDLLDAGTLQNQNDDDYNAAAWGLPYHILQ